MKTASQGRRGLWRSTQNPTRRNRAEPTSNSASVCGKGAESDELCALFSGVMADVSISASIFRHFGIDAIRPCQNSAGELVHFFESGLAQKLYCLGTAHAGPAVRHNFLAGIQFIDALGQIAQRDQMSADIADLVFVRLAHGAAETGFARGPPVLQ